MPEAPGPGAQDQIFRLLIPADLSELSRARELMEQVGLAAQLPGERLFDLKVAVSEAAANAIEHAESEVEIAAWIMPDRVIVEVTNDGAFQPGLYKDNQHRRRGLGLPLMVSLADQVHVSRLSKGGTQVSLTFFLGNRVGLAGLGRLPGQSGRQEATIISSGKETGGRQPESGLPEMPLAGATPAEQGRLVASVRWFGLFLPAFVVAIIVLSVLQIEAAYNPVSVYTALNLVFLTLVSLLVALLAARSFLAGRSTAVLLLGAGALSLGLGAAVAAAYVGGPKVSSIPAIYNTAALLAGLFHLGGAITLRRSGPERVGSRSRLLALAYLAVVVLLIILVVLVNNDLWPAYFVQGSGDTSVGFVVLWAAAGLFAASALLLRSSYSRSAPGFNRWYALGLGLIAVGLAGVSLQLSIGDPLNWVSRASQYVGGLCILVAILSSVKETGSWILPVDQALRESEDRYRSLVELSPDAILVHAEGRYVFANPAAVRLFGVKSATEIVGRDVLESVHPDDRETVARRIDQAYGGAVTPPRELRIIRSDGRPAQVELSGKPAVQLVMRDIAERKQVEQALRSALERQALAQRATKTGFWDWDITTGNLVWSPEFFDLIGLETTSEPSFDVWLNALHPEDRESALERINRSVEEHVSLRNEYRIVLPDGRERWISALGDTSYAADGRPLRMCGICMDVTDRKQAEDERERLLAQEQALAAGAYARSLLEAALDPLVTISPAGKITDVNEATVKITGREREELIGSDFSDYFTDPERARQGYREVFAKGSVTDYPLVIQDKNGRLYDVLYNASVYTDPEGDVLGVFAAARDITALRMLEVQRSLTSRLQEALLDNPRGFPGVSFSHLYRSATKEALVGGDFYDIFEVRDGRIAVLIGDVSGHGVEAARVAILVKDVIQAFSHEFQRPHLILRKTNEVLIEKQISGFVTVFLGILDTKAGVLIYSSAGHPNGVLRTGDGNTELLEAASAPLGVFAGYSWKENKALLNREDLLFLYTDGATEARRDGDFFGQERLLKAISGWSDPSLESLPRTILGEVLAFSGGDLADDVALLAVEMAEAVDSKHAAKDR
jgi:PAS domain S-box-containing protein